MNDKTNPASETPGIPPGFESAAVPPSPPRPFSYWVKKLLVCNPFYLASAALLLYGIHRLSLDANLFSSELRQLVFNFSALQCYELLLVLTATLLVTRRVWYDASLLVVLESMLWIVPFILVSQAAFIGSHTGIAFCSIALGLVVGRVGWLRFRARDIVPQTTALLCGLPIVIVNAAWPIIYRHFGETKLGKGFTTGPAYEFNEFNWFWVLPLLVALLFLLPSVREQASTQRMRPWFPLLLLGFWLVGSGVHLYALGYVYDFELRREQLAPLGCVLAWGLQLRLADFVAVSGRAMRMALLFLPVLATALAISVPDSRVFFYLSTLNLAGYGILLLLQKESRLVLQLGLVSFAAMVATVPIDFAPFMVKPLAQTHLLGMAAVAYVIVAALLSRNPKVAIVGALAATVAVGLFRQAHADWMHWAAQAGFAYFLLHSLRWRDAAHEGADVVRAAVAGFWVLHTFIWVRCGANFLESLSLAGILLLIWSVRGWVFQNWRPWLMPVTAGLVSLCWPTNFLLVKTQSAPAGLLYLAGSFALFGLGTLVALTKHRWHKPHQS